MDKFSESIFVFPPQYLKAGLLVSLLSVLVLIGLFFYLNYYTRRRYFTMWATAWLFYALWLIMSFDLQTKPEEGLLLMLRQWCISSVALFLFWGSARFLGHKANQRLLGLFLLFLYTWSYIGAFHLEDWRQIKLPIYTLIALASLRTSWCFVAYRYKHPYVGAGLLALGFLLWGLFHIAYPFLQRIPELHTTTYFTFAILQLFIAVSMIVLVLEEARKTKEKVLKEIFESKKERDVLKNIVHSAEERYKILFEQASEAIVIISADDFRILDLNKAAERLFDVKHSEALRLKLVNFLCVDENDIQQVKNCSELLEYIKRQRPLNIRQKNGSIIAVEVDGSVINYDGKQACQLFIKELTERARLEHQLRQAEKLSALGQVISGVAHELNNPLSVIKGYLEIILKHHPLAPQTRSDLEKVAKESERAVKLVKNFLTFARERATKPEPVNINELILNVMDVRRTTTKLANVDVRYELAPELPMTMANPEQIQQVIVILVDNALHAMEKQPEPHILKFRTSVVNGNIMVEVQDNGPGVPVHLENKIFEPFFTTKEVGKGTGLGLSIAHSILTEHNGRIWHKRPPEGGACFVFELPIVEIHQKPQEQTEIIPQKDISKPASYPARVLVVDDEPAVADMLCEILELLGYIPAKCNSAVEALELISKKEFDVVISDIRMPVMDGQTFYKTVSEKKPELAQRVIFITGDTINEETKAFLESTGNYHLAKPFQVSNIQDVIEKIIQQRRTERARTK